MDSRVNVLIVDDDAICREILREAIEHQSVEVSIAADGVEGLEKLAAGVFDILITDINMPHMDGLTLLREARQRYPHILTIIITGYGTLESAIEAIRQGTYDYIQKPFKIEEMIVTTRNAIEKITILREKNRILEELQTAYKKLNRLESKPGWEQEKHAQDALCLFPRHTMPLAVFENPGNGPVRIMTLLQQLGYLKEKGIINDRELDSIKRRILQKLESV